MNNPLPLAIFDIGSNAVRLTVYRQNASGKLDITTKAVELCELGRLNPATNTLYPEGVTNAIKTIDRFCQMVRNPSLQVAGIIAVATEAIRRASDGPAFISRIKSEFDLDVQILSEHDEGVYGARGVLQGIPDADGIVADLGGGSLQLTRVSAGKIGATFSMPIGTLRLLSMTSAMGEIIDTHLLTRPDNLNSTDTLYVIGGSWRSLAKLYQTRAGEKAGDVQGMALDPRPVQNMVTWLTDRPRAEMTAILTEDYHLEPKRAEGLGVAGIVLTHIITQLKLQTITVSSAGIRDGLVQAVLDGSLIPHPVPKTPNKAEQNLSL